MGYNEIPTQVWNGKSMSKNGQVNGFIKQGCINQIMGLLELITNFTADDVRDSQVLLKHIGTSFDRIVEVAVERGFNVTTSQASRRCSHTCTEACRDSRGKNLKDTTKTSLQRSHHPISSHLISCSAKTAASRVLEMLHVSYSQLSCGKAVPRVRTSALLPLD